MKNMKSDLEHEVDASGHSGEEGRKLGYEKARWAAIQALTRACPNGETQANESSFTLEEVKYF